MTIDLYTSDDIKKVRKVLLSEQNNKCLLTGLPISLSDSHTDHAHDSEQLVRGALHRHANLTLGKLEGLWLRYLSFWYPNDLPTFLRQAADYLDRPKDRRWRYTGWIKKLQTRFGLARLVLMVTFLKPQKMVMHSVLCLLQVYLTQFYFLKHNVA